MRRLLTGLCIVIIGCKQPSESKIIAFYSARQDLAHISFVEEANSWFIDQSRSHQFQYFHTTDWSKLNADTLRKYDLVVFLDTRPEARDQRQAFEQYMKNGGSWLGFHFAGFALTPSDFPQDWNWYHDEFIGAGQYVSNTWRPTSVVVKVESDHPATSGLPATFSTAPSEWYRWENDLRQLPYVEILLSIDSTSFPVGTGPKPDEIWHSGYYPIAWSNRNYRMIYTNMGHNDMDYESGSNRTLSSSFSSKEQNQFIINALLWLVNKKSAND